MQSLQGGGKSPGLFSEVSYSFKVIIRQDQRNVRSSAPLIPSHQRVFITILLLLSSSLTGWPALKYTLNHLQACAKWPIGSLLSVIKWRNSQHGGHWRLLTQGCLSTPTWGILKRKLFHCALQSVVFQHLFSNSNCVCFWRKTTNSSSSSSVPASSAAPAAGARTTPC